MLKTRKSLAHRSRLPFVQTDRDKLFTYYESCPLPMKIKKTLKKFANGRGQDCAKESL